VSTKTEALIRDVAALFVKYRLSDWTPLLDELERRGGSAALAAAIRRHAGSAQPAAPAKRGAKGGAAKRRATRPKAPQLQPRFVGPHAETVDRLREALVAKRSLPSVSSLRSVNAALGIKAAGSNRREVLIAILTDHLNKLDADAFEKALRTLAREEERDRPETVADYDRWFHLITAGRKPAQ
jgi:hypothetical protein